MAGKLQTLKHFGEKEFETMTLRRRLEGQRW